MNSAKPPHPQPISKTLSPILGLISEVNFLYLFICAFSKSNLSFSKMALE